MKHKISLIAIICTIIHGCIFLTPRKFSDFQEESAIDSISYNYKLRRKVYLITEKEHLSTIKEVLMESKRVHHDELVKTPPFDGVMKIYCEGDTFTYQVWGDVVISSGDKIYVTSPKRMSSILDSITQKGL